MTEGGETALIDKSDVLQGYKSRYVSVFEMADSLRAAGVRPLALSNEKVL
jgi:hypothetical protein